MEKGEKSRTLPSSRMKKPPLPPRSMSMTSRSTFTTVQKQQSYDIDIHNADESQFLSEQESPLLTSVSDTLLSRSTNVDESTELGSNDEHTLYDSESTVPVTTDIEDLHTEPTSTDPLEYSTDTQHMIPASTDDEHKVSTGYDDTADDIVMKAEVIDEDSIVVKSKPRPPMPTRPPPPLTRPPRPFPPPSINEAHLVKKRPPPTPPLIIDSRSSPQHVPHSQRTLKTSTGEKSPPNRDPPKRPPRPTSPGSTVHVQLHVESEDIATATSDMTGVITSGNEMKHLSLERQKHEEQESRGPEAMPSHFQNRKMLGKMKESFRNFAKRRNRTVYGAGETSDKSPQNWKRVLSMRNTPTPKTESPSSDRYAENLPTGVVDPVLVQCVAYLNREDVLKEPGLFRIPGDLTVIKQLKSQFFAGDYVDLSTIMDPNIVTGLLKVYFRDKPSLLIANRLCISRAVVSVRNKDVESFKEVLSDLDDVTVASLRMLSELFKKIAEYSEENHMTSGILATSCGPSFFPNVPPSSANSLIKFLTDNCDEIFTA